MTDTEKKIHILQIIGNLRFGGAQTAVKQIVENSSPDVFQHSVYSLRPEPNEMSIDGEVIEHSRFHYDIRKFIDLIKICKDKKIDIIHTHLHKSVLGGLLLTFFCPVKVIIHEHGPISDIGLTYSAYRFLLRFLHCRSSKIITVSSATASLLHQKAKIPHEQIQVVPNAVDLSRFQPSREVRTRLRQHYSLRDDDIVIGFAGRLNPVKGIDCLVESMKILTEQNKRFKLVIAGSGPLEKPLIQKTKGMNLDRSIRFLGYQKNISDVMNAFDIGCMPSRREAFGISAIEMMSMQIPLVCSAVEGLAVLTENYKTALHINEVTPKAIAKCILELSENQNLRENLIKNALDLSRDYGIDRFVSRLEKIYHETINAQKSIQ